MSGLIQRENQSFMLSPDAAVVNNSICLRQHFNPIRFGYRSGVVI
jgi:hypothetical protein